MRSERCRSRRRAAVPRTCGGRRRFPPRSPRSPTPRCKADALQRPWPSQGSQNSSFVGRRRPRRPRKSGTWTFGNARSATAPNDSGCRTEVACCRRSGGTLGDLAVARSSHLEASTPSSKSSTRSGVASAMPASTSSPSTALARGAPAPVRASRTRTTGSCRWQRSPTTPACIGSRWWGYRWGTTGWCAQLRSNRGWLPWCRWLRCWTGRLDSPVPS